MACSMLCRPEAFTPSMLCCSDGAALGEPWPTGGALPPLRGTCRACSCASPPGAQASPMIVLLGGAGKRETLGVQLPWPGCRAALTMLLAVAELRLRLHSWTAAGVSR